MTNGSERYKKGSLPPFLALSDAFSIVGQIYEQGGGRANYTLLSRIFDNSPSSSSFTKKLAWLKIYGLIVEQNKGELNLSDLGLTLAAPMSKEAELIAKKEAFLRVDVYYRIFERHKGKLLPADEFLKNIIEQDCGIPRELSDAWVSSFKDAIRTVGLLHDRGDQKTQIMESPWFFTVANAPAAPATDIPVESKKSDVKEEVRVSTVAPLSISGHNTKILLSGQRYAIFSIPDSLSERDAHKIKSAITGLSAIIDSMVEEREDG